MNLNVFSVWTCRTFPEVLVVERAGPRAFLVGVVGRFPQGLSMHFFIFLANASFLPDLRFFFLAIHFVCSFLLRDLHLSLSHAGHKPPQATLREFECTVATVYRHNSRRHCFVRNPILVTIPIQSMNSSTVEPTVL